MIFFDENKKRERVRTDNIYKDSIVDLLKAEI